MKLFLLRLQKLLQILRDPFLTRALLQGAAAGTEHRPLLQTLSCACVVDVGANRGQFALIARKTFPQAFIHSFEPLQEPAQVFQRIFAHDDKVKLHPCAIGEKESTAEFHVAKDDDSSSLLPAAQSQTDLFPGAAESEVRTVSVLPLSRVLPAESVPANSLLKIDVQGFELEVLKGSQDLLDRFAYLYIECSFIELYQGQALAHEVIAWLAQRGFILSGIHNLYYENGRAVQGDFFFTKQ